MLGVGRSRGWGRVKGDPSCTHGEQAKHGKVNEDDVLTKSSERDAGASDKAARIIESGRNLPVVEIARKVHASTSGESRFEKRTRRFRGLALKPWESMKCT